MEPDAVTKTLLAVMLRKPPLADETVILAVMVTLLKTYAPPREQGLVTTRFWPGVYADSRQAHAVGSSAKSAHPRSAGIAVGGRRSRTAPRDVLLDAQVRRLAMRHDAASRSCPAHAST